MVHTAHADTTTINYKGQPPPSAISPSISAFSQDVCIVPVTGSVSSTLFGVSGGSGYKDVNCERIKLAKTLNEYYTISALGIVHLYTEKVIFLKKILIIGKKKTKYW